MFTGIITHTTDVVGSQKNDGNLRLVFAKPADWDDMELGESISTDGVCLTVAKHDTKTYTCELIPETLQVSSFGKVLPNRDNLERSLKVGDRLSGHFVQGHVDDIGRVIKVESGEDYRLIIAIDPVQAQYVIYKGTIIVDGVALTVAKRTKDSFTVALARYTLDHTTLEELKINDTVNLEFDMIGKYVVSTLENK